MFKSYDQTFFLFLAVPGIIEAVRDSCLEAGPQSSRLVEAWHNCSPTGTDMLEGAL